MSLSCSMVCISLRCSMAWHRCICRRRQDILRSSDVCCYLELLLIYQTGLVDHDVFSYRMSCFSGVLVGCVSRNVDRREVLNFNGLLPVIIWHSSMSLKQCSTMELEAADSFNTVTVVSYRWAQERFLDVYRCIVITFYVRRSWGNVYWSCLSVCLSLATFPYYCTDPHVSCVLLGGFSVGAQVLLLWQHSADHEMSASACTCCMPS